jgi:PhnB protein
MATINLYLHFNGTAEEAFNFYKSVFGGEFATVSRFGDMPKSDDVKDAECPGGMKIPESDLNKIMHISLPIGEGSVLMGSDVPEPMLEGFKQGDNFTISVNAESKEDADRLFNSLADGGKVEMPLGDTFWGAYFGMLKDKFGISWMVNYDYNSKN